MRKVDTMVKTIQQRRPYLYDTDGTRKARIHTCHTCGKIEKGRFPLDWIGCFVHGFCSFKCYSEDFEKAFEDR